MAKKKGSGRYRDGSVYARHHNLEGLEKILKEIAGWRDLVHTVIPGSTKAVRGSSGALTVRVQRVDEERAAVKCVARKAGSLQDLTIIAHNPRAAARLAEKIRQQPWGK